MDDGITLDQFRLWNVTALKAYLQRGKTLMMGRKS